MEFLETGKSNCTTSPRTWARARIFPSQTRTHQGIARSSPCLEERGPGRAHASQPLVEEQRKKLNLYDPTMNPALPLSSDFFVVALSSPSCKGRPSSRRGKTGTEFASSRRGQSGQWASPRFLRGPARGTQARSIWSQAVRGRGEIWGSLQVVQESSDFIVLGGRTGHHDRQPGSGRRFARSRSSGKNLAAFTWRTTGSSWFRAMITGHLVGPA